MAEAFPMFLPPKIKPKHLEILKRINMTKKKPDAFPLLTSLLPGAKRPEQVAEQLSDDELYHAVIRSWAIATTERYTDKCPDEVTWHMVCTYLENRGGY
jgi:hypothetical protein